MRHLLFLLLTFAFSRVFSQQLIVVEGRDASFLNGRKMKNGDAIRQNKKVEIEKGGLLVLMYDRWTFYLEPGMYDIDSVLNAQKRRKEYRTDDSIYSILKKNNLTNCKMAGIQCQNVNRLLNPNEDRKENIVTSYGDSILLRWDDRADYKGLYYILFSTMFDELIHLIVTDKKEAQVDLGPLKKQKSVFYKVISQDCIESYPMTLRME